MYDNLDAPATSPYFDEKIVARSILIDMEPKAINKCLNQARKSSNKWSYNEKNIYFNQSGRYTTILSRSICNLVIETSLFVVVTTGHMVLTYLDKNVRSL